MELGSLGEWIGGLLATGPAVALWLVERRSRIDAERALADTREEGIRRQAAAVVMWFVADEPGSDPDGAVAGELFIQNASGGPVFDVKLMTIHLEPDGESTRMVAVKSWAVLLPGQQLSVPARTDPDVSLPYLNYRDAAGHDWDRDHLGDLVGSLDVARWQRQSRRTRARWRARMRHNVNPSR